MGVANDVYAHIGMIMLVGLLGQNDGRQKPLKSAVVEADNQKFILVNKEKSGEAYYFEKREVQTRIRENGIVQILNQDDFDKTESVLIIGTFNLVTDE